ncbi:MAG: TolC family protein, partial [Halocynthiibacter sp.]
LVASQARARSASLRQRMGFLGRQIDGQNALDDSGLGDLIEVSSLRSERSTIASEEALESARYAEALGDLALLTGSVVPEIAALRFPQGIAGSERRISADQAVATGLEQNPVVMSAALGVVGAELDRRRALAADFAPVLAAYAMLEREEREDSRFGGGSLTQDTTVGVRLTIPIFNGRGRGYETLPATVGVRAGALDYYARRRQIETEIRTTHARMGELSRAMGQAGNAARQSARALGSERDRLATGQSADLAVAARELRLSIARERTAFYQVEYLRSWARLQYLMGADLSKSDF